MAQPTARAEQVTQLVLGETGTVLERTGQWRRVRTDADAYDGWIHLGYLSEVEDPIGLGVANASQDDRLGLVAARHGPGKMTAESDG